MKRSTSEPGLSSRKDNLFTSGELKKVVDLSHGVSICCDKVTALNYQRTLALKRETLVFLDVKHFNQKII